MKIALKRVIFFLFQRNDQTLWNTLNLDSKHFTVEGHLGNILHRGVETLRLSKAEVRISLILICYSWLKYKKIIVLMI